MKPTEYDQDDTPLVREGGGWHKAIVERPRKHRGNWFVIVLCLATLAWFIGRAIALRAGL